ncbi:glyoxalase superfamily protein [Paracoccus pacificus]|uniref:Glyoxalase superfamily protein n=1 Tax=Paracoccus pacificus TaxID=1463598 RepID=A0ABW4R2P2_9RHOB
MAMTHDLNALKSQAKNLRAALDRAGTPVTHSQALELVAQTHGARDWNTAHAAAEAVRTDAPLWQFGGRVAGRYLGHPFTGRVIAASERGRNHHALTIAFDTPVDVAQSDLMTVPRKRINATVNASGRSISRTSDGQPHLVLEAA